VEDLCVIEVNVKLDVEEMRCYCVDWIQLASCEYDGETSGSIKYERCLDQLSHSYHFARALLLGVS
jgi:hypothetical protein